MAPKIKVQTLFWRSCFFFFSGKLGEIWASLREIWAIMLLEVCFDLTKCTHHVKKCSHAFGGHFLWGFFSGKFREIWAKILRTPKNFPAPTPTITVILSYVSASNCSLNRLNP